MKRSFGSSEEEKGSLELKALNDKKLFIYLFCYLRLNFFKSNFLLFCAFTFNSLSHSLSF